MTESRLTELLARFRRQRMLVIGDVMLDRFLWGNVTRISPEAPVPVVHVQRESAYPGGAANVARNLTPFTPRVSLVGLLGRDAHGAELLEALGAAGIDTAGMLSEPDFETIVKTRVVARQQQVVRVDRERKQPVTKGQREWICDLVRRKEEEIDALILQDYGKGLFSQELVDELIEIARRHGILVSADPNPASALNWNGVHVLKPNRAEAFRMAGLPEPEPHPEPRQDQPLLAAGQSLRDRWDLEMLLVTLGERGMMAFRPGEEPLHVDVRAQEVFDISGAGDTAVALLTLALAAGAEPVEAVEVSNYASGIVVGKLGTATLTPAELTQAVRRG